MMHRFKPYYLSKAGDPEHPFVSNSMPCHCHAYILSRRWILLAALSWTLGIEVHPLAY